MSALQLQIRPPLMRSCPSDPEEEEEEGGGGGVPLTQPRRREEGPLGDPQEVRGHRDS